MCVVGHLVVDTSVVWGLVILSVGDWMDLSDLMDWSLMMVRLILVLSIGVMSGVLMVLVVGLVGHWVVLRVCLVVSVHFLVIVVLGLIRLA